MSFSSPHWPLRACRAKGDAWPICRPPASALCPGHSVATTRVAWSLPPGVCLRCSPSANHDTTRRRETRLLSLPAPCLFSLAATGPVSPSSLLPVSRPAAFPRACLLATSPARPDIAPPRKADGKRSCGSSRASTLSTPLARPRSRADMLTACYRSPTVPVLATVWMSI